MIEDAIPSENDSHERICKIAKEEEKADRWAKHELISDDELLDCIIGNYTLNIEELADYFEVSVECLLRKVYYMSLKKKILLYMR